MNDLISRTDAINAIIAQDSVVDKSVAKRILIQLPSVEQITAEWLPVMKVVDDGKSIKTGLACSECGNKQLNESNYCPYCGAKMIIKNQQEF